MTSHHHELLGVPYEAFPLEDEPRTRRPKPVKGRILVVEDEELVRDSLEPLFEENGYEVFCAENGLAALTQLRSEPLPDVIVLDLKMPVMNGWEFRTIQKDDPKLGLIPVVAISADVSAQARAVSAHAYLNKPIDEETLLATINRVLREQRLRQGRSSDADRLASLGQLAANIGHEINNPLAFVMLNLSHSIDTLQPSMRAPKAPGGARSPEAELEDLKARAAEVFEMLEDCQSGAERIRETITNLQRLSRHGEMERAPLDVHRLIEQSVAMAWDQIRERSRFIKDFGNVPSIRGNAAGLAQVFLNLLVNAAQAVPAGQRERNEIRVSTRLEEGENGREVVVEISDSGAGIAPEVLPHVFEPFFTTKPVGKGTGLGLSISRQTVSNHGGRMTAESEVGTGTIFRVFLPLDLPADLPADASHVT